MRETPSEKEGAVTLAFIGGTGPEGLGLAIRFAAAGEEVVTGSRSSERAGEAARKIKEAVPAARASGALNEEAVRRGDIVFVTVPYGAQRETLTGLRRAIGRRLVVSTVVPLLIQKGSIATVVVEEGSAAQEAQALLPEATVVAAFQNLSAGHLQDLTHPVEADVLVCGDQQEAKRTIMALAERIQGVRAVDGGPLANARYVEGITALLLTINRLYRTQTEIRITGL